MAVTEQATVAQTGFIESLLRERETDRLTEQQRAWLEGADLQTLNKEQASRVITTLKALPKVTPMTRARVQGGPRSVPNGRYAIDEGDGVLRFFKVNSPTEGRWVGWTFVDIQASDELYPIKDRARKDAILTLIAIDVKGAMLRYGQEIGCCGHCGRTLTNEVSRELGIGPICRAKMEW